MSNFRSYEMDRMPPVVKTLIIINVAVFIAQMTLDSSTSLTAYLVMHPLGSPGFSSYQMLTHMFAHSGIGHIFFNMLGLYMFGKTLENLWGSKRFLAFYMICGVGAAALHLLIQYASGNTGYALGASGAVMGVLLGFAMLFPNTELYLYFILPIKAKWLAIGIIAFDLFYGLKGTDNIAHFAHLGGAATGAIMVWIWNQNRSRFY